MDSTSRDVALQAGLHFLQDRATVRVFSEPHDCKQDGLFEGADVNASACTKRTKRANRTLWLGP